jgi:hypothetical protein
MLIPIVAFIVLTAGIISYAFSTDGKTLLFPVSGDMLAGRIHEHK